MEVKEECRKKLVKAKVTERSKLSVPYRVPSESLKHRTPTILADSLNMAFAVNVILKISFKVDFHCRVIFPCVRA